MTVFAKPTSYSAAQITSGVFDVARIPNLPASHINSGVFAVGLIPFPSPGPIGGTTPAAGTFTAISGSSLSVAPDTDGTAIANRLRVTSASDVVYLGHFDTSTATNYALSQNATGTTVAGGASQFYIHIGSIFKVAVTSTSTSINTISAFGTSAALSVTVANAAREVIIARGTTAQSANLLEGQTSSATTKVWNVTPGGAMQLWQPPTSGNNVQVGSITPVIPVPTNISYEGGLALYGQGYAGAFEGMRIVAGSAAKIGFLGAPPSLRIDLGSWAGLGTDTARIEAIRNALTTFGFITWAA